jgi:hypothetical protein
MTSAELLDLFNRLTGRPKADAITDATKYTWLKEAQDEVISEVASVAPKILYQKVGTGSLPALLTTDQNVFTFGVDTNGDPVAPFGAAQIYKNISDIPIDRSGRTGTTSTKVHRSAFRETGSTPAHCTGAASSSRSRSTRASDTHPRSSPGRRTSSLRFAPRRTSPRRGTGIRRSWPRWRSSGISNSRSGVSSGRSNSAMAARSGRGR